MEGLLEQRRLIGQAHTSNPEITCIHPGKPPLESSSLSWRWWRQGLFVAPSIEAVCNCVCVQPAPAHRVEVAVSSTTAEPPQALPLLTAARRFSLRFDCLTRAEKRCRVSLKHRYHSFVYAKHQSILQTNTPIQKPPLPNVDIKEPS